MLTQDDYDFLSGPFGRLDGWCIVDSAALTMYLQREQARKGVNGCSAEIGVYKGKYLSVLRRGALLSDASVLALDTYDWAPLDFVKEHMTSALGSTSGIRFHRADSSKLSPEAFGELLGSRPSWISVDGDHSPSGVAHDLMLAEAVLAPTGIIAIDDFPNLQAIGVLEGVFRHWLRTDTRLRPFCQSANKLFVCFESCAEQYASTIPGYCETNKHLGSVQRHMGLRDEKGLNYVQQELLGRPIWII
jgi:hypothetical protein